MHFLYRTTVSVKMLLLLYLPCIHLTEKGQMSDSDESNAALTIETKMQFATSQSATTYMRQYARQEKFEVAQSTTKYTGSNSKMFVCKSSSDCGFFVRMNRSKRKKKTEKEPPFQLRSSNWSTQIASGWQSSMWTPFSSLRYS